MLDYFFDIKQSLKQLSSNNALLNEGHELRRKIIWKMHKKNIRYL